MGEQFISDRARHSRTERCATFEQEIKRRSLFSDKPHLVETEYSCEPTDSFSEVREGEAVNLFDEGGDSFGVMQENRRIGTFGGVAASHCLSEIRNYCPAGGVLPAFVVQTPGFDGSFAIKLALPGGVP